MEARILFLYCMHVEALYGLIEEVGDQFREVGEETARKMIAEIDNQEYQTLCYTILADVFNADGPVVDPTLRDVAIMQEHEKAMAALGPVEPFDEDQWPPRRR